MNDFFKLGSSSAPGTPQPSIRNKCFRAPAVKTAKSASFTYQNRTSINSAYKSLGRFDSKTTALSVTVSL